MTVSANFLRCLPFVLREEGGYQSMIGDTGNWTSGRVGVGQRLGTNYGISAAFLWSLNQSQPYSRRNPADLTMADAEAIYSLYFWGPLNCENMPLGVAQVAFDWEVNSGEPVAAKRLQMVLGLTGEAVDGDVGSMTLALIDKSHADAVISLYTASRIAFYRDLGTPWTNTLVKRATDCSAVALNLFNMVSEAYGVQS